MIPMWQTVLMSLGDYDKAQFYRSVQRTRRRVIPISLNGKTQLVRRADVRDYMRDYLLGNSIK